MADSSTTLSDYWLLLKRNKAYRYCFIGFCIENIGNWFTYVAMLNVAVEIGGDLFTSAFLITRLLPKTLFSFVFAGIADTIDKKYGLIYCSLGAGFATLLQTIYATKNLRIFLFFVTILLRWSFNALYNPVRSSLISLLVGKKDLQAATSLDVIGWSAVSAFGGSLGGFGASYLGNRAVFVIDFFSFVICAYVIYLIPDELCKVGKVDENDIELTSIDNDKIIEEKTDSLISKNSTGLDSVILALGQIRELLVYLFQNPLVIFLCLIQGCQNFVWGPTDIFNVKYSEMTSMQTLGDHSATLGIFFSLAAVGCQIGPLLYNYFTSSEPKSLIIGVVIAFSNFFIGYLIQTFATDIYALLFATMVIGMGGSVAFTYSTLLVQIEVPVTKQGRVFTFNNAISGVGEILGISVTGYFFGELKYSIFSMNLIMVLMTLVFVIMWFLVYLIFYTTYGRRIFDEKDKKFGSSDFLNKYVPVPVNEFAGN